MTSISTIPIIIGAFTILVVIFLKKIKLAAAENQIEKRNPRFTVAIIFALGMIGYLIRRKQDNGLVFLCSEY